MTGTGGAGGRVVGGRYRLERPLGRGGMGTVWLGVDEVLRREVAVKEVTLPHDLDDGERRLRCERAMREALATARVQHPNVVTVFDVVEDAERPWIVMELLRAHSLADMLEEGRLGPEEAADIGLKVLAALRAACAVGVLHRDVKPSNILIAESGRVVLTDFGIATVAGTATLTGTGMLVGSPEYLAPERVLGRRPGPASDLWSLGATLYEAVEGRSPFRRTGAIETLTAVLQDEPVPPRHAGALAPLLGALLRKDPAERPDEDGVERALRDALRPGGTATPPPVPPPPGQGTTMDAGPFAAGAAAGFAAEAVAGAPTGPGTLRIGPDAETAAAAYAASGPRSPAPGADGYGPASPAPHDAVGYGAGGYGAGGYAADGYNAGGHDSGGHHAGRTPGGTGAVGTGAGGSARRGRTGVAVLGGLAVAGAAALAFYLPQAFADQKEKKDPEQSPSASVSGPATPGPSATSSPSAPAATAGGYDPSGDDDVTGTPQPSRSHGGRTTTAPPSATASSARPSTSPSSSGGGGGTIRPTLDRPIPTVRVAS